jgi:hypothetical protein
MRIRAGDGRDVEELKRVWVEKHGIEDYEIKDNCFFCEYTAKWSPKSLRGPFVCRLCPARKIDKTFDCCYVEEYHYEEDPLAFSAEIHRLNRIRLKKRK